MNDEKKLEEFVSKLRRIENEIKLLQQDKKDLFDDYKNYFKPKVLREALRVVKKRIEFGEDVNELDNIVEHLTKDFDTEEQFMNPICPGDLVRIKKDFIKHLPVSADDNCWRSPMLVISVSPDRSDSFENDILQNNKRLIFLMSAGS